jgi:hypothetical protein
MTELYQKPVGWRAFALKQGAVVKVTVTSVETTSTGHIHTYNVQDESDVWTTDQVYGTESEAVLAVPAEHSGKVVK